MQKPTLGALEWALLLLLGLIWGSSFFFFKILVEALPPFTVVFGRLAIASAALMIVSARSWTALGPRMWAEIALLAAISNVVPFSLIAYGETRISSGLAAILNASTPIFTALVAHMFMKDERLSWNKALGVIVCFAGVTVLVGPSAFSERGQEALPGELACLGAALVYGFATVYGRRFRAIPPLQLSTAQSLAAAFLTLPLMLAFDRPWSLAAPGPTVWAAYAGLGLLCTALAYLIYFRILKTAGATNVSLVTILAPVSAILLGVLFLGETLEWRNLLGLVIIAAGLVAMDGRLLKRLQPAAAE